MTVISRKQQSYDYPNSNNGSDTESLHLPSASASDAESLHSEPAGPVSLVNRVVRVPCYDEFGRLKRNSGKRKQRRHKNRSELQTLVEEDEENVCLIQLMEDYRSPFGRLLEDKEALLFWNSFTNLSEDEQAKLVEPVPKQSSPPQSVQLDEPVARISSKLRRAMKIKKNLPVEVIQKLEDEIINYFMLDPQGVFYWTPSTSFERLLLHAIAQYHKLMSKSYFGEIRNVEIYADKKLWVPMEVRFCDFVEKLRQ